MSKSKKKRHCTYKHNTKMQSQKHCCYRKAISIIYSECVSIALVIQQAKLMCHIIFPPVACLAVLYFLLYLINGTIFRKMLLKSIKCVF